MKKISAMHEQITKMLKETRKPSQGGGKEEQKLEFVNFDKSIEQMLTGKSDDCQTTNIFAVSL